MPLSIPDICDAFPDAVRVVEPQRRGRGHGAREPVQLRGGRHGLAAEGIAGGGGHGPDRLGGGRVEGVGGR